jgi:hypothetical protein
MSNLRAYARMRIIGNFLQRDALSLCYKLQLSLRHFIDIEFVLYTVRNGHAGKSYSRIYLYTVMKRKIP